ncbi:MAG: D-2-hydroxyacid dehydrogenase [Haloarculaceae archaeon]
MPTLLVHPGLPLGIDGSRLQDRRDDLAIERPSDEAAFRETVGGAEVVLLSNATWEDAYLDGLSPGDWVQSMSAGNDRVPLETLRERGVTFARGTVHGAAVAEHALALALALLRGVPGFRDRQREREWDRSLGAGLGSLAGRTTTVVGLGAVGEAVVRRALAFDARVVGITRRPEAYDGRLDAGSVHPPAALLEVLAGTDVLVLACPLTEETRGMVGADALDALPDTAVLVNVARGPVVDEAALVRALRSDGLAGAGLDVFEEEPLPEDSPLWDLDSALLTPHVAVHSRWYADRVAERFLESYDRWRRDDPPHGTVVEGYRTG